MKTITQVSKEELLISFMTQWELYKEADYIHRPKVSACAFFHLASDIC